MSGRRAALRVAARNARHNRKRTVFLVLLVAVPVALAVAVAGIVRASNFTPEEQAQLDFGAADVRIDIFSQTDAVVDWVVETIAAIDPDLAVTDLRRTGFRPESNDFALVSDLDLSSPLTRGMFVVLEGRPPTAPGEVAVSPRVAESMDLALGDTVEFDDLGLGRLELVGIVAQPIANSSSTIVLSPGRLRDLGSAQPSTTILLGGQGAEQTALRLTELWEREGRRSFWPQPAVDPKPAELEFLDDELYVFLTEEEIQELVELAEATDPETAIGLIYQRAQEMVYRSGTPPEALTELYTESRSLFLSRPNIEGNSALFSTGVAALLLIEVAFITGAAFAAGTRRRLHEIGLLGANGASQKHIRLTVFGEGLSIGVVGSAVGILLGMAVLLLGRPLIQRFAARLLTGLGVGVADMVGPVAVALISVLIAVWIPARTASQVPTTTALQGRMPPSVPRRWTIPTGIGASLTGGLLVTVSLASRSFFAPALVGVGGFLLVGGVALLASPILAGLSRLADRVPATSRLVLRDAGRHRTRASVAVSAIMVILLAPVAFLTVSAMSEQQSLVAGLPEPVNHLLVQGSYGPAFGAPEPLTDADIAEVEAIVPERLVAIFDTLGVRAQTRDQLETAPFRFGPGDTPEFRSMVAYGGETVGVAIADEGLLTALDDDRLTRAIAAGEIVVLGVEDRPTIVGLDGEELPATEVAVPVLRWGAMPRVLLPASLATRFEDANTERRALFVLDRPMTDQEQQELQALSLATAGGFSFLSDTTAYAIATGAALVAVLIVIALVTAVSAAEIDEELAVIVAVGSPGSFRRRFLGLLTGYQTLVAAALALPLGLTLVKAFAAAGATLYQGPFGQVDGRMIAVPWVELLGLAVMTPLIVGLLTWISVRSAPVTPPRRAT